MNEDNTNLTLPCPQCGQSIETTVTAVKTSPFVTCAACGLKFKPNLGILIEDEKHDVGGEG